MSQDSPRPFAAVRLASVAAIGGFLFGYDSGVINGAVAALQQTFETGAAGTGLAVASVLLGCAAGALVAGPLADRFGRKPMMLATALLFLFSSFAMGASPGVVWFIVFRLISGLAVGGASVLAPAYIAEISPERSRGRLGSLQQLAIVLGLFMAFLDNDLLATLAGSASATFWLGFPAWRWMFWLEAVPSLVFALGVLTIPESPRFLVAHGQVDAARAVFARVVGGDVEARIREVEHSLAPSAEQPGGGKKRGVAALFVPGSWRLWPIVWVGIGLSVFQQLVGINIIFYYGEVLWEAAGASEGAALRNNVITGLTNILATLLAIALIDRIGRKPLLLAGSLGMVLTLAGLTAVFATGRADGAAIHLGRRAGLLGLVAANLYILAFGMSWGPVVWVMLGEMFSNRFRGAALATAAAAQWLANFLVTMTFPPLLKGVGLAGAYLVYTTTSLLSFVFVLLFVVETRGKKLEEM